MTYPTVFANLAAGNQPTALFDTMYNICGNQGVIACTAVGINAITLTANTNFFNPGSYLNYQNVIFAAAATSTGNVTLRIGTLAFLNVYKANLVQAASGDIVLNQLYQLAFNQALNGGVGGFIIMNATAVAVAQPTASALGLVIAVASNTRINISAAELVLEAVGGATTVRVVGPTGSIFPQGPGGAGGLDTGVLAANTWYFLYGIYNINSATFAGIISVSSTAAGVTLPGGYTHISRLGMVRTAPASVNLMGTVQQGSKAQYAVGNAQTTTAVIWASGAQGDTTIPTFVTLTFGQIIPPPAIRVQVYAVSTGSGNIIVAPNSSYGAFNSTTNAPPLTINSGGTVVGAFVELTLEQAQIFWASTANGVLYALGWTDSVGGN